MGLLRDDGHPHPGVRTAALSNANLKIEDPRMKRWPFQAAVARVALLLSFYSCTASAAPAAPADTSHIDVVIAEDSWVVPPELTFRARIAAITPAEPADINWRIGGEGLGGTVNHGVLGAKLDVGKWSPAVSVASLVPKGQFPRVTFITITAGSGGKLQARPQGAHSDEREMAGGSTNVRIDFEFAYRDKVIKRFTEHGPNGGTVGLVIPAGRLAGGRTPDSPEFVEELSGLLTYAKRRAERLEALPWANEPLPTKYAMQTDLGGYGQGIYYGIRTTDPAVIEAEVRTLRQLGINGLRNAPGFLLERVAQREGWAKDLHRLRTTGGMGFPVPRADARRPQASDAEAGCPFAPGVPSRTQAGVEGVLSDIEHQTADEFWSLTVDEIGSVFDNAPEGKRHVAVCPRCAVAFRGYVKNQGRTPEDFGAATWEDVRPFDSYQKDFRLDAAATDRATGLRAYYTGMFVNQATAGLFTPLRDAVAAKNLEERRALAAGEKDTPAARRPWTFSYALRGNTFLMSGHSLDFFDFYRYADNAFVYETSNREPRIWQWDSYLCDVGRVVSADQGLRFGVYVKPHRGAPIQRALSAASRGAKMLYWYTYGPDWAKGDTFASDNESLDACSKAARLIARSEDVLYGSSWHSPAEVAVVIPRTGELFMRLTGTPPDRAAAWENAKWIYTALSHAHIPVDPLDEQMLADNDLSRYKVIYINGTNLTRVAAHNVAKWVEAGGTLYTSGGGLRFDEANQPLTELQAVLGLKGRKPVEMWKKVALYGGAAIEAYDDPARAITPVPASAKFVGNITLYGEFAPVVGREVLEPAEGAEILGHFADGGAAVTRHAHGKGAAWVIGLFPGLEYSAPLRNDRYDMRRDLDPLRRALVAAPTLAAGVRPIIDCNHPAVEGVLLRNDTTGRRAVTLMNWTYRIAAVRTAAKGTPGKPVAALVPLENVKVTIRGVGTPRVRWAMTGEALVTAPAGDGITVAVPSLEEAAVLLLE